MPKRRHPTIDLIKYAEGQIGPGGSLFQRPEVLAMRRRAMRYILEYRRDRNLTVGPRSECRELWPELYRICETYYEHLSWYHRTPRIGAQAEAKKVRAAARNLQSKLALISPQAVQLIFRGLGVTPPQAQKNKAILDDALRNLLVVRPPAPSKRGARAKTHLTQTIPAIVMLWQRTSGRPFVRTVTQARGANGQLEFVAEGPAFVHGLLVAIDNQLTLSEVRTALLLPPN